MIVFHFFFDLDAFHFVDIDFQKDPFWYYFPRVIVTIFFLAIGLSFQISQAPNIRWQSFWKRFSKIAACAGLISLGTYILFPQRWISFGTLHCIALISLALIPFLKFPVVGAILGLGILIFDWGLGLPIPWPFWPKKTLDYIPFFPWVAVSLIGNYLACTRLINLSIPLIEGDHFPGKIVKFCSRHSLIIYMAHQPILFSLVAGIAYILKWAKA